MDKFPNLLFLLAISSVDDLECERFNSDMGCLNSMYLLPLFFLIHEHTSALVA